jgi:hypothetical protein
MEAIPSFTTAQEYLNFLGARIGQCKTHWEKYGNAVNGAYAYAWHRQEFILTQIKKNLDASQKAREAMLTFALNLLTVGVGGGVAGALAKKAYAGASDELKKWAVETAKEKIKEPIKKGTEWSYKHLASEPAEEAFKPAGISPDQYGSELMEGIEDRAGMLDDALVEVTKTSVTLGGAKKLTEDLVNSPFMQEMPSRNITSDMLKPKASLALWLAWGWNRDVAYWSKMSYIPNDESVLFEPLRKELINLDVPSVRITQKSAMPMGRNFSYTPDVINMDAFISWSKSSEAIELLFRRLPANLEWVAKARMQWQIKMTMLNIGVRG